MRLEGKVTKIEMFGAFVDVGLEVPGLVHISTLRRQPVNRVEDVVQLGQLVRVWVHRVDPVAGRLELTMIPPLLVEWKDLKPGLGLRGKVVKVEKFGAFVDVGAERPGLVHVSEMSRDYIPDPGQVVKVGDEVDVVVLEADRKKRQIRLSMKAAETAAVAEEQPEPAPPTSMEIAMRRALERSAKEMAPEAETATTGRKRRKTQEDILSRTLETRVRTGASDQQPG
ncbi:MAG: S1 RNA-binding domain-containing protein [Chloroflexota bacterium]